jgi:hypothetical protein
MSGEDSTVECIYTQNPHDLQPVEGCGPYLNQRCFHVISTKKINVMMLNQRGKLIGFARSHQRQHDLQPVEGCGPYMNQHCFHVISPNF